MSQLWVLLALASLVAIVGAQEILCPQHRHLNGEINKCKVQLPDLSGKKDKVAALSLRYGLICAREVDPDISIPDIKERRCRNDDPQDFPRKFYACWNKLLETDELLTKGWIQRRGPREVQRSHQMRQRSSAKDPGAVGVNEGVCHRKKKKQLCKTYKALLPQPPCQE
uniref:Putative secreted protein n=1 Tax=Ixodes ricinus TaxID=34613 RepID=V5GP16_IXORI